MKDAFQIHVQFKKIFVTRLRDLNNLNFSGTLRPMKLKKGTEIVGKIDSLVYGGRGIGSHEGMKVLKI